MLALYSMLHLYVYLNTFTLHLRMYSMNMFYAGLPYMYFNLGFLLTESLENKNHIVVEDDLKSKTV